MIVAAKVMFFNIYLFGYCIARETRLFVGNGCQVCFYILGKFLCCKMRLLHNNGCQSYILYALVNCVDIR